MDPTLADNRGTVFIFVKTVRNTMIMGRIVALLVKPLLPLILKRLASCLGFCAGKAAENGAKAVRACMPEASHPRPVRATGQYAPFARAPLLLITRHVFYAQAKVAAGAASGKLRAKGPDEELALSDAAVQEIHEEPEGEERFSHVDATFDKDILANIVEQMNRSEYQVWEECVTFLRPVSWWNPLTPTRKTPRTSIGMPKGHCCSRWSPCSQ